MKKQKIQLIIMLIVLAVVAGTWFFLGKYNKNAAKEKADDKYTVMTLDSSKVKEIQIKNDKNSDITLVLSDKKWSLKSDKALNVDDSKVISKLNQLSKVTSSIEIKDVTDFDQYGLEKPTTTITLTFDDGKKMVLNFGNLNSNAGKYYARIGSENTVYFVDSTIKTAFDADAGDFEKIDAASSVASSKASND